MWSKLGIRVASGVIGAILVVLLIFAPIWMFNLAVSLVCLIALHELCTSFHQETKRQLILPEYLVAVLMLLTPFLASEGFQKEMFTLLLVAYLALLFVCAVLWHDTVKFYDVAVSFFAPIYAVLFLYHLMPLRAGANGAVLIFLPFLGAWIPDTFAYFSGKLFGKHKLIPQISPNKTVEGSVGAVLGCVLIFFLFGLVVQHFCNVCVHYVPLLILSVLCGIFAQFGDLAASLVKRECHKKDFGNLIPGHGGILDRVDSLIFIAPLVYYFTLYFPVIS